MVEYGLTKEKMSEGKSELPTKKGLSELESKMTARLLKETRKMDKIPHPVFNEILGTIPGTALEVVPLHVDKNGDISVFLTKRDKEDKFWPDMWHSPGTIVINKDESEKEGFEKAWERLKKDELMRDRLSSPIPVSVKFLKTKRGMEVAYIHFVLVPDDLVGGKYFRVDSLPKSLIDHHLTIIREAANDLSASYKSGRLELDRPVNHPQVKQNV
jgi:hypothetical protein